MEQTFDVLKIGTRTYRNVTITTKNKDYVFFLHSAGMMNIKVKDLSPELRKELGYPPPSMPGEKVGAVLLKKANLELAKLNLPQLGQMQKDLRGLRSNRSAMLGTLTPQRLWAVLGAFFVGYLLFCYCGQLICQKAGEPAGALIWIPVLQMLPLLRAARMSGWWLLAFLVPILNLVAQVVWSVKIVQARAKNAWLALLLLLPGTNLLTFLYLGFSAAPPKKVEPVVEIMTLDTA